MKYNKLNYFIYTLIFTIHGLHICGLTSLRVHTILECTRTTYKYIQCHFPGTVLTLVDGMGQYDVS